MVTPSADEHGPNWDDSNVSSAGMTNGVPGNLAFVLRGKRQFYYEARPIPSLPSENHVIVKVCATGLCGSDVCTFNLQYPFLAILAATFH